MVVSMSHKHTGNGQKQFVRVREALFRLAPKGVIQGQRQKKESFKGPIGRTMGIVELALKPFSMTPTIQLMMLSIAAVIMILCNVKTSEVASGSVFKSGMTAIVSVYGVAWMADTYFGAYLPVMKKSLSDIVLTYPWMYAIVLFLVSKLINSQAAAVTVIVPMALSVGVDPLVIVGFMPAAYGYFVLPTYPSDLACIGFDRSGTTHIGKFIINHSFLVPGLIGVGSACFAGYMLVHMVY